MIYTITAYPPQDTDLSKRQMNFGLPRVFGYFHQLYAARAAVAANTMDMQECLYTHIVIESVPSGIHATAETRGWFQWSEEGVAGWRECETPEWAKGVSNHAMG